MENPFIKPGSPADLAKPAVASASEAQPAAPLKASMADDHAPISMAIFAGAVVNVVIALLKDKWGFDFSGQEGNLTIVVMGLAGYMTKRKQQ
jgi:hypothetical protein